uniref:Leishmanolysin-like peptidase n=1 Tax=Ditylenchus dipsaci TaxID=166011 RepID=A0A915EPX2_9BILA
MDFAQEAKGYARIHFGCENIAGIEAEDDNKIHLSEYIFGNELMTPVINNGANYFTHFSASILEETYYGNLSWYMTNRHLVEIESGHYWWGRQAGCAFLTKNCFELIHQTMSQQQTYDWHNRQQQDHRNDMGSGIWQKFHTTLPFCDERDYLRELTTNAPKEICLSNGTHLVYYTVKCQLTTTLKIKPINYEPISLQSQYPQVEQLLRNRGAYGGVYGSDYDYRYCPLPKVNGISMLED